MAQCRFDAYAETSGQVITSKSVINDKWTKAKREYDSQPIPISPYYLGFAFTPETIYFYSYRTDQLSDLKQFKKTQENEWQQAILSS